MTLQLLHDLPPPALNLVHVGLRLQFESLMFTEVCVCAVYSSSSRETQAGKKKDKMNVSVVQIQLHPLLVWANYLSSVLCCLFVCCFLFLATPKALVSSQAKDRSRGGTATYTTAAAARDP